MIRAMRSLCSALSPQAAPRSRRRASPRRAPESWDPGAAYITAGQDEPGYRSWYLAARGARRRSSRSTTISSRPGRRHRCRPGSCCAPPPRGRIAAASRSKCRRPRMAEHRPDAALRPRLCHPRGRPGRSRLGLSQSDAQPCAGGAPESAHKLYSAIDLVPLRPITRDR